MTKRNKIVLFSSIFLALCVIGTLILNLKYTLDNGAVNIRSLILIGILLVLSIISVPVVYFGKVRKSKFEEMLNTEYFQKYEIIKDTVRNSQLSNAAKKEIKEDVLDMLISAQKSGRKADDAVGSPEDFSRNILVAYAKPGRFPILSIIDGIVFFLFLTLGASIFLWFEQMNQSLFETGVDILMLTFFFIISFIILPVTKKLTSTHNYWMFLLPITSGIVFVIIAELIRKFFYNNEIIRQFLDGTVRMIPSITILILFIILIPALLFLKSCVRKRLLKTID